MRSVYVGLHRLVWHFFNESGPRGALRSAQGCRGVLVLRDGQLQGMGRARRFPIGIHHLQPKVLPLIVAAMVFLSSLQKKWGRLVFP